MSGGLGSGIAGGVGSGTTAGPGIGSGIGCVLMALHYPVAAVSHRPRREAPGRSTEEDT
jgi:hypothetical protein